MPLKFPLEKDSHQIGLRFLNWVVCHRLHLYLNVETRRFQQKMQCLEKVQNTAYHHRQQGQAREPT